jgi:hypothetical protein
MHSLLDIYSKPNKYGSFINLLMISHRASTASGALWGALEVFFVGQGNQVGSALARVEPHTTTPDQLGNANPFGMGPNL